MGTHEVREVAAGTQEDLRSGSVVLMQRLARTPEEHRIVHGDVVSVTRVRMLLPRDVEVTRGRWMARIPADTFAGVEQGSSLVGCDRLGRDVDDDSS